MVRRSFATNKGELTPIGKMHTDCANFVEKYGQPGCMVTQIALLNDFYSGWMPADHIAGRFQVWNGMDYEAGDFLTDAMISLFFPNYERSGFFMMKREQCVRLLMGRMPMFTQ